MGAQHRSVQATGPHVADPFADRARVADAGEGITADELQLAARNHGMPLEALRYDVTPVGLHYLLTHYDIPPVDPAQWRLAIGGHVEQPIVLGLAELRAMPAVTARVTIECAGNGRARLSPRPVSQPWLVEAVGTAEWTGTPLAPLLASAQPRSGAVDVTFLGADHGIERGVEQDYERGLPLTEALAGDALLAYEMNGAPLAPQHGAPVRLVVPGWYGMAHVKWLRVITVLDHRFAGFQNERAYRFKVDADDPGEPVSRIRVRALMVPPGFPDFMTRARIVEEGMVELYGRAWSGSGSVSRVEVSADGGASWADAVLDRPAHRFAWQSWRFAWPAKPGRTVLCCRATDVSGAVQPLDQAWNRQGMGNNMAQRIPVTVRIGRR